MTRCDALDEVDSSRSAMFSDWKFVAVVCHLQSVLPVRYMPH
jgi:hypothetical protein